MMSNMRHPAKALSFTLILALVVLSAMTCAALTLGSKRPVEATVNDKERVCDGNSDGSFDCKYLIYTSEGTFELTDSFLAGRFNSSDVYGQLHEGERYSFEVMGWRIPWASAYPNIASNPEKVAG